MTSIINKPVTSTVEEQIMRLIPPELQNDKAYLNLVRSIHTVAYMEFTQNSLKKYMKFREATSCDGLIREKPPVIEEQIADFLAEGCKDIKNSYKRGIFASLKLFYSQNDVNVNWSKLSKRIGKKENIKNRAYHLDEITRMLEHADHREKVVILLLASTGMRIGALPAMNIGDLKEVHTKEGQKMYAITVYRGEPEEYVTFCTPECARAIDNYVDFRRRIREPLGQGSPLVRNAVDVETAEDNPDNRLAKRVKEGGIRGILDKVAKGSGVKGHLGRTLDSKVATRYEAHLSRAFRKFYFKAMINAKVEPVFREALIGHKQGMAGVEASNLAMIYGAPEETELFEAYVTAIDYLTINQSETLAKKNEKLKDQLQEAMVSRKEFEDLKAELFREWDAHSGIRRQHPMTWQRLYEYGEWREKTWTPEEIETVRRHEEEAYAEYLAKEEAEARKMREREEQ